MYLIEGRCRRSLGEDLARGSRSNMIETVRRSAGGTMLLKYIIALALMGMRLQVLHSI